MKFDLYKIDDSLVTNVSTPGGILTGPLLLTGNAVFPKEAIYKQYVDLAVSNIDANAVKSGTFSINQIPAFTGEVINIQGSNIINLKNTEVFAGEYPKVMVGADGRVTLGTSLLEEDIPNFSWNKIKLDKPTNLNGYGIVDGLNSNNGTVINYLTLFGNPINANDLATKEYTDSTLGQEIGIVTGDVINTTTENTPVGFLKANGASVNKVVYANLYSIIGDKYSNIEYTFSNYGTPWKNQYLFNTDTNNTNLVWNLDTNELPYPLVPREIIVTKNRVYILGSVQNYNYISDIYTAPINSDGTIGSWTTQGSLPTNLTCDQIVLIKNKLYLLGTYNNANLLNESAIYLADIDVNGVIGSWSVVGNLPTAIQAGAVGVVKNNLYIFGGYSDSVIPVNTVYYCIINDDGSLGSWNQGNNLPQAIVSTSIVVTSSRVYLLGSYGDVLDKKIYTAVINTNGSLSEWNFETNLPITITSSNCIVTSNKVYLIGGFTDNAEQKFLNTVYSAPINSDGTIGNWILNSNIPNNVTFSKAFITSSRLYFLGGYTREFGYLDEAMTIYGELYIPRSEIYYANFNGGSNDYLNISSSGGTVSEEFKLPDYTNIETSSFYYYIKT